MSGKWRPFCLWKPSLIAIEGQLMSCFTVTSQFRLWLEPSCSILACVITWCGPMYLCMEMRPLGWLGEAYTNGRMPFSVILSGHTAEQSNCMRWPIDAPLSMEMYTASGGEISAFNTLRPRQNGRHFADDIFNSIFLNKNVWTPIKISLKFVPKGLINNIPALVQIMAWRRPGDKPLSEPMGVRLPVTRPQWVNSLTPGRCGSNFKSAICKHMS